MKDPQDFRRWAHEAADWSADYLDTVAERPVRAQVAPGEVFRQLPSVPPHRGEAMEAIFADLDRIVMPGMTHWQHPRFFAYFPANSSPPSVVAELVTAALAAQCRSEEHTSELQSLTNLVCRLLLEKKKKHSTNTTTPTTNKTHNK